MPTRNSLGTENGNVYEIMSDRVGQAACDPFGGGGGGGGGGCIQAAVPRYHRWNIYDISYWDISMIHERNVI